MTKAEAIESIKAGNAVVLSDRDATGEWFVQHAVWLDGDELVQAHPTESRGTVAAPDCDQYKLA